MPIDPSIPLQVQTPNLGSTLAQIYAIKGAQQQQQLRQQELLQQQQEAPLRLQALQQQVQAGQEDHAARQALNAAYAGAVTTDASGNQTFDTQKLMHNLSNGPAAYKSPEVLEGITKFQKSRLDIQTAQTELQTKQNDMLGSAAAAVKAANYDPTLAHSLLDTLPPSPQLNQIRAQIDNPQALRQLVDTAIQNSPKQRELAATEAKNQATAANQQATRTETARHNAVEERAAQQRIGMEAARLNFEKQRAGFDPSGGANTLAQAIARGQITPDRMGYLLARNPGLLQGVMQEDPSFDSSKAQSYPAVYKDFTSGKTANALNSGATALGHLQELKNMNTVASHIPGTADYNAYMNKVDTVATELAKFYGDATVSGIGAIRKTLASQLPGTRDAAIKTQAQSMGDKLDAYAQQWANAAPSKAYQAPMPGISRQAQAARASLSGTGGGTVKMQAPNGQTRDVPADQVDHYRSLGAKVVNQ